jgi:signal transduction histidine kinase
MDSRAAQKDSRIELQPGRNTLFIRTQTIGAVFLKAQILVPEEALAQDLDEYLQLGAVLAIYAMLSLVMAGLLVGRRDAVGVLFYFHIIVCLTLYVLVFGFFETFIAAEWAHGKTMTRVTTIVNFLSFQLLMQAVQGYFGLRLLQRLTRFAAAGFGLLIVLFFTGDPHLALKLSATIGAATTLALLITIVVMLSWLVRNNQLLLSVRLLACAVVGLFIEVVCRTMLEVLGVLEGGAFLLESPAWRGIFIPLILLGFLWQWDRSRNHQLVQQKIDQAVVQARAKDQAIRLEAQSQFMAMLMHELKTPLYVIQIAAASLSRHTGANDPDVKRLDNISRAVDDLNFIIDQCVQADHLDQGDLKVNKAPVALEALLSEVRHIKGHERITLTGMTEAWVTTEFQYARIILINLITNALKYSPPDSPVTVLIENGTLDDRACLTVRVSNAVGAAGRPDADLVFTRYYRSEGAKKEVGAGLGLWLAKSLATKLGSELRYSADAGLVHFVFSLELT